MTPEIRALLRGVMSIAWVHHSVEKASREIERIRLDSGDRSLPDQVRANCRFVLENLGPVRAAVRRASLGENHFDADDAVDYVVRRVSGEGGAFPHSASAAA